MSFLLSLILWLLAVTATNVVAPKQKIKVRYGPHKGQWRIHKSKARFRVVACGRRFGKTLMAVNEIVRFALEHKNANCAWVAPWFKQSKMVYRLIRKAFARTGTSIIARKSDSELRFEFVNGSVIQFFSAENYDSIRGDGYHFIVIDEAADALRDPKIWTDAIRPALSDTAGVALIIGTPKGRNLFFMLFNRGNDPEYADWASFHAITADNPYIPREEIETAKKELPEDTYQQEYDAQFLEESAGVFRRIESILAGLLDLEYQPQFEHEYVLGWDPAKYNDFSVLTLLDVTSVRVVWWDRFNQFDYTYQIKRVVAVARRFNAFVLMDSTGVGDVILEQLREAYNRCDGYLLTNPSKKTLIETLQLGIQDRAFTMPKIEVVVNELRQFEYRITPSRNVVYGAPDGAHDDCVISLALAYYAMQMQGIDRLNEETASAINEYVGY
jgi:hypothetical protein